MLEMTSREVSKNTIIDYVRLLVLSPKEIAKDLGYDREFVIDILTELLEEDKLKVTI